MKKFLYSLPLLLISCYHDSLKQRSNSMILRKDIFISCETDSKCGVFDKKISGTATRIKVDENYYWLTAGHVCYKKSDNLIILNTKIFAIVSGSNDIEIINIVKIDEKKDLCILDAKKDDAREISKEGPSPSDPVFAVAYPSGIFSKDMMPIYDGRWSGKLDDEGGRCLVTIPVSGGSSGASILNKKGEVVGVISSVSTDFNHITITPCYEDIIGFLSNVNLPK